MEISVVLNHNVDELLVGIVRQVRLRRNSIELEVPTLAPAKVSKSLSSKTKSFLCKLFRVGQKDNSSNNLYDLWVTFIFSDQEVPVLFLAKWRDVGRVRQNDVVWVASDRITRNCRMSVIVWVQNGSLKRRCYLFEKKNVGILIFVIHVCSVIVRWKFVIHLCSVIVRWKLFNPELLKMETKSTCIKGNVIIRITPPRNNCLPGDSDAYFR